VAHAAPLRVRDVDDDVDTFVGGQMGPAEQVLAAVMFTDVVRARTHFSITDGQPWPKLLCAYNDILRRQAVRYNGRIARSGDGAFVQFAGAYGAFRCVIAVQQDLREIDLDLRAGLHAGEVDSPDGDNAVVLARVANRICCVADSGRVFASRVFGALVAEAGPVFEDAGTYHLGDVPGTWNLLAVNG